MKASFLLRTWLLFGTSLFIPQADGASPAAAAPAEPTAVAPVENSAPSPQQLDFFEKKIRPVLADRCFKCHGEDPAKIKGGLTLTTREGMRQGGDSGPAVIPGNLADSLLIEAINYHNKDFAMPPQKAGGKLSPEIIADFTQWIASGAADPRSGSAPREIAPALKKSRDWWAFQPLKKAPAPAVKNTAWPRTDLDRFIMAGLESKGLQPVADAGKLTLLRRLYFDLIGLPPSLADLQAFEKERSPEAVARVVDRLLASPRFGERWGRHWLDVARYAESTGKDVNFAFPQAWRYRDYVLASFNADKPYDVFLREQIAGDLLPAANPAKRAEQQVATGFLAIGAKSLNEKNPRQFALDLADEQIDTTSQAMLGLTVACARCHDHKFDPIAQRDYYALAGIFLSTETRYGTTPELRNRHPSGLVELPEKSGLPAPSGTLSPEARAAREAELAQLKKQQQDFLADRAFDRMLGGNKSDAEKTKAQRKGLKALLAYSQIGELQNVLDSYDAQGRPKVLAMGVQDRPVAGSGAAGENSPGRKIHTGKLALYGGGRAAFPTITDSPVFARGDVDKPGEKVPRALLCFSPENAAPRAISAQSSGRLELADWLVSRQNPLTARVFVNRVWSWIFGRGLVESVDNFGKMGSLPSNPALLDTLALNFQDNGWSVKKLIREIVLSRTYQLASTSDAHDLALDPDDVLCWRMPERRLDAEALRDAALAISGQLQLTPPLGSSIARIGDGVLAKKRGRGPSEQVINAENFTRSVYLSVARDLLPDALALFDFAEPSLVTGAREVTSVPTQALYLLNDSFIDTLARSFAQRVLLGYPAAPGLNAGGRWRERVEYAYWLAFSRPPDLRELTAAERFFRAFPTTGAELNPAEPAPGGTALTEANLPAWTSFCRALFATAEFRYLQ